jgi:LmbE family N-acetylglucosaminyl deacetylase
VVVVSPHLDDAVFSLGAAIAGAARSGAAVTVLTLLAGDPDSGEPASRWDGRAGFRTEGAAARARREEDRRACHLLGATPQWVPASDMTYGRPFRPDLLLRAVRAAAAEADVVLVPGFPLVHPDHQAIARLILEARLDAPGLGVYVEEPYAANRASLLPPTPPPAVAGPVEWETIRAPATDRAAKRCALRCYRSQLRALSWKPFLPWRVARYERRRGGETVGWIRRTNARS